LDKSGTILSMTYTPTGLGGTFVGELNMAYDPCGNLALMTNATGDPQVSYAYDRGTTGITDVYNPGGIENIITIAGKQGQITLPGFGDDWITLPIQRPGQMKALGRDVAVHIMADGTVPHIWGPDCGEVGTCGGYDFSQVNMDCFKNCWKTQGPGTGDWDKDSQDIADWLAIEQIERGSGNAGNIANEIIEAIIGTWWAGGVVVTGPAPHNPDELYKKWHDAGRAGRSNRKTEIQKNNSLFTIEKDGSLKFREADIHNAINECIKKCTKTGGSNPPGPKPPLNPEPLNCR
jgi:hypothetical protein